jgi:hypothetical protein
MINRVVISPLDQIIEREMLELDALKNRVAGAAHSSLLKTPLELADDEEKK